MSGYKDRCAKLQAEVERLRDALASATARLTVNRYNAFLRRPGKSVFPEVVALRERTEAAEARLATALGLLERWLKKGPTRGDGLLNGDTFAFVSGGAAQSRPCAHCGFLAADYQPAAPSPRSDEDIAMSLPPGHWALTCGQQTKSEQRRAKHPGENVSALESGQWQPAAPTRAEADEGCECPGAHECGVTTSTAANERKARTEAEQAVLDAMARADTEELVALVGGELPDTPLWEIAACRAELARRGLK